MQIKDRPVRGWLVHTFALLLVLPAACGAQGSFTPTCDDSIDTAAPQAASPISLSLFFLSRNQVRSDDGRPGRMDYRGDWPQCFAFGRRGPYVRDVSPFVPSFVYESLSLLTPENASHLGLTNDEVVEARTLRERSLEMMLRFGSPPSEPDAWTFGFWPEAPDIWRPGDRVLETYFDRRFSGPRFYGSRTPLNLSFFPPDFAIPTDADDTAGVYVALLDAIRLSEWQDELVDFSVFFSDWRDLGQVPQRNKAPWLGPKSGAFLTWLAYRDDPARPTINDVDPLVNANILYVLGRAGKLDSPGVTESVALINDIILSGAHRQDPDTFSLYYPDSFAMHFFVARANAGGGVAGLRPAAEQLTAELVTDAIVGPNELVHWDRGDPHLNTAFALLTLQYMTPDSELIPGGLAYLIDKQNRRTGAWDPGVFFVGRMEGGDTILWTSRAFTTALAMEALIRQRLFDAARSSSRQPDLQRKKYSLSEGK